MGSYKEVKGNLLDMADKGHFNAIAHGANCFSTMGAGIAKQIKERYPKAFLADNRDRRIPRERLGDLSMVLVGPSNFLLFNLYTQYNPGPNLDYSALELSLRKMAMVLKLTTNVKIGLPQIGCGIAGGDWERVKEIIQRVLSDFEVTVVIFE